MEVTTVPGAAGLQHQSLVFCLKATHLGQILDGAGVCYPSFEIGIVVYQLVNVILSGQIVLGAGGGAGGPENNPSGSQRFGTLDV